MPPSSPASSRLSIGTALALVAALAGSPARSQTSPERKVADGIATTRLVPGAPYELAGRRVVFANWYFIQPGDLDWRDAAGKSVYVVGNSGPTEAQHVGIAAPRGIR